VAKRTARLPLQRNERCQPQAGSESLPHNGPGGQRSKPLSVKPLSSRIQFSRRDPLSGDQRAGLLIRPSCFRLGSLKISSKSAFGWPLPSQPRARLGHACNLSYAHLKPFSDGSGRRLREAQRYDCKSLKIQGNLCIAFYAQICERNSITRQGHFH
jgi:hypothetical protein